MGFRSAGLVKRVLLCDNKIILNFMTIKRTKKNVCLNRGSRPETEFQLSWVTADYQLMLSSYTYELCFDYLQVSAWKNVCSYCLCRWYIARPMWWRAMRLASCLATIRSSTEYLDSSVKDLSMFLILQPKSERQDLISLTYKQEFSYVIIISNLKLV